MVEGKVSGEDGKGNKRPAGYARIKRVKKLIERKGSAAAIKKLRIHDFVFYGGLFADN
ncbi:MAG: hypothetical protein WC858_02130 [Parcubacteria group bacterium]|jgi:hypothetical protein